jgi:ATP-dependent 26S proteasome regulatory subunit
MTEHKKRPLSSIDLEPAMKADITSDAEKFFGESSQAHYENISQPWRKGYLLHSAPGCSKSSLSVALTSHFNVTLRSTEVDTDRQVTLSGLLNVIDGADAAEGRLLIMTTNYPGKLDKALIHPGQCDRKYHLRYASKITSRMTFMRIFGLDTASKFSLGCIDRLADAFAT